MNDHGEEKLYCNFHPGESVVGVCAHCLKERLRALAAEQGHHPIPLPKKSSSSIRVPRKHIIKLPQVFALYRLDSRYHRSNDECDDEGPVVNDEDSFISVRFDDNGHASWDSKEAMTMPAGPPTNAKNRNKAKRKKNAVEKSKKSNNNLRWKKRIGQILQLARSKRSSEKSNLHAGFGGKIAVAKGRKGWIIQSLLVRTATARRR